MIEFFKEPNIDWMGKAKYFYGLSAILLIAGFISIYRDGIRQGIDFKGGTNVTVRFDKPPNIEQIRTALRTQGLGNSEIQSISSSGVGPSNEVLIFVGQTAQGDQAEDATRAQVVKALDTAYGPKDSSKPDFNAATPSSLATVLSARDPANLGVNAGDRYQQLARALLAYRDSQAGGVLTNFDDLSKVNGATPAVVTSLKNSYSLGTFTILGAEIVGPKVGGELRRQAVYVTLYALGGMLVYIAFRFHGSELVGPTSGNQGNFILRLIDKIIFGAAAVLAVFHDVLITLGFFSIFKFEISLTVIAALLTLVGYSMNDTIVIFDRIRENSRLLRKESFANVVNKSINQTLSRTILTSGLTFLTVLVLFLMGGQVLRAFSFALVVGIVVGTYSSFGIAAPLVVAWNHWRGHGVVSGSGPAAGPTKARSSEPISPKPSGRLVPAGRR